MYEVINISYISNDAERFAYAPPALCYDSRSGVSNGWLGMTKRSMLDQFAEIKAQHPDTVLFFRMGDFYEMFHEDAVIASEVLGITLTSRDKNSDNPVPMA